MTQRLETHHDLTVPRHMLLRASAGAGKTYELSNRYLLLLRQGATPDQILATTFTRKAAGEILSRVLTRLANAACDESAATHLGRELGDPQFDLHLARQILRQMVRALHHISICTIDSFFYRLTRCFAFELGMPYQGKILEESHPIAQQIRYQAIDVLLTRDDRTVLIGLLRRLYNDTAQRRITDGIDEIVTNLYEVFQQAPFEAWSYLVPPHSLSTDQLTAALKDLKDAVDELPKNKNWTQAWSNDLDAAIAGDWLGFLSRGLARRIASHEPTYYKKPIPTRVCDVYQPLIQHGLADLAGCVARQTAATFQLLQRFDRHYRRLLHEQQILLIGDLTHALVKYFAPTDEQLLEQTCYRLDGHILHLLLDEFQDTSPEQWHVIRAFAHPIDFNNDEGTSKRTFFCVGDVKQAIYGWRGGCAALFDEVVKDLGLPLAAIHRRNISFRSAPMVLKAVNLVFGKIAEIKPLAGLRRHVLAWQNGFQSHRPRYPDRPGYVQMTALPQSASGPVECCDGELGQDGEDGGATPPYERFVAAQIRDLAQRASWCTMGVLVCTNKAVKRLIYELRRIGVPASGEGGTPVTDDPAVELILAALTMADHPGHSASAFHVLHSPLAAPLGLKSIRAPHVAVISHSIRRSLMQAGCGAVLCAWAQQLAPHCTRRSIERLTQVIELAEQFDPTKMTRVRDFRDHVETTAVEDPTAAQVRVMTIHKAKGLEFDVVVLAELEKRVGQVQHLPLWTYREHPTGPPAAVFRSVNKDVRPVLERCCPAIGDAYQQELGRRLHDDLSALYVAMTRPRHALYMFVEPIRLKKDGTPSVKGLHNKSYAAILRHALADVDSPAIEGNLFTLGDCHWWQKLQAPQTVAASPVSPARPLRVTLAANKAQIQRPWRRLAPSTLESAGCVDARDLLQLEWSVHRHRGVIMHAWFEQIAWLDDPVAVPENDSLLATACKTSPAVDRQWLGDLLGDFKKMLQVPAIVQVLRRPADLAANHTAELWREKAFAALVDDAVVHGKFDRVVIHRDPVVPVWAELIDFKTGQVGDCGAESLAVRYRPQMEAYRAALSVMLSLAPDQIGAMFLFVDTGDVWQI